jgi:acyl-CoA synthetase (AMP-forming)/AMP-acid ligase II/thioesterase domain-containing protein
MDHLPHTLEDVAVTQLSTVRAWIDAMAAARADATFLVSPEATNARSFGEVQRRLRAIGHRLTHLGLRRGDSVAAVLSNGLPAAELMLAAMYSGFVPVPLNPGAGHSQLTYTLQHCDANVVLVGDEYCDLTKRVAADIRRPVEVIAAENVLGADLTDGEFEEPVPPVGPDDMGLLIYTSGSTGVPKGATFTHRQLLACAWNTAVTHQLTADDRFYCVLPLYHMNSVDKLLAVLVSGGAIVMPQRFNVATFWEQVRKYRCTWLAVVPTIVAQLLQWSDRPSERGSDSLQHVRFVRCSSAPLPQVDQQTFEERFGLPVLQGLGMTEAGGIFLNPLPPKTRKVGSLGVPYGFEVKIVDDDGHEVAPLESGEIFVRGPSVMQGYYKNAAATAEVLGSDGWLRTGDRGYRDHDGYFFSVGRSKELIIKAGTNIAPQEIDHALAAHPAVFEAAAVGVPDPYLGEDVVAHVVLKPGSRATQQELRDFCAARLGEFRTPTRIYFVDALPKGPSGKVQRLQLKHQIDGATPSLVAYRPQPPAAVGDTSTNAYSPPRTPLEKILAGLWEEALRVDAVSIDANFFALGGYSLLALEILSRLRRRFSIEAPLRIFFEAPTVAEQAASIGYQSTTDAPVASARASSGTGNERDERIAFDRELLERVRSARPASTSAPPLAAAVLLTPVRPGCVQPPLFCIYGAARYLDLAKHLGPEQPTYGLLIQRELDILTDRWEAGRRPDFPSIEELAALYLEQMRGVQSAGPYYIAGHSFGGRIALEIAQQLRRRVEAVALLAVFDTFMPGAFQWSPLRWITHHVLQSIRRGPTYALRRARRKVALLNEREEQFRATLRRHYVPQRYPGSVVLFRAADGQRWPGYDFDPGLGWAGLAAAGLTVHEVPGDHQGILKDPNVQVLARELRRYLAPA